MLRYVDSVFSSLQLVILIRWVPVKLVLFTALLGNYCVAHSREARMTFSKSWPDFETLAT